MNGQRTGRRFGAAVVICLATLLLAACGVGLVVGSGKSVTEERTISGVAGVELSFVGDLRITQGNEEKLVITADDNVLPLITTEVRSGILNIGSKSTVGFQPMTKLQYDLTVRDLHSLKLSGAGNATMDGLETGDLTLAVSGAGNLSLQDVTADRIEASLSGLGNMEIGGKAARQDVKLSGAGNYSAGDLQTGASDVTISGLGSATVWVIETLDATISGAGNIDYYGDPQVTKQVSGLGDISSKGEK